jgi:hypothetical protein
MADDEIAGPSQPKRQRKTLKNELTDAELKRILEEESSDEDFNIDSDSDYGWCDSSDESNSDSDVRENVISTVSARNENTVQSSIENISIVPQNSSDSDDDVIRVTQVNPSWKNGPPDLKTITFTGNPGLRVAVPNEGEPIDYFFLFADNKFIDLILHQTNLYAENLKQKNTSPKSRMSTWKTLNKEELLIFLGLVLHMGNVKLNRLKDYWVTNRLYNIPVFHNYMGRNRFMNILRCLHFNENQLTGVEKNRLNKIQPLLDLFNKTVSDIYYPNKELCIDESMILWRGRLVFRQYIKNKKHKYGIKLYLLTEPDGTVLKICVYTGQMDDLGGKGHASNVVLHLMEGKLNVGHSIYMDNYYNSPDLSKKLLELNTHTTGTLRSNRKGIPVDVSRAKLKAGESIYYHSEGVGVGKWKDKRDVMFISTEFENINIETKNRRGQLKLKPQPIAQYNKFMSGIDHQDQMLSYYHNARKSIRWYKKLAFHIIDMMVLNSYKLYCKTNRVKIPFYDFRLAIIDKLLPENASREGELPSKDTAGNHFIAKCETSDKGRKLRKKCRQCFKKQIRKDTMYYCRTCPNFPGLCLECFKPYHMNEN